MGRRLAWAQATIHNPKLLILDEPTAVLTPQEADELFDATGDERAKAFLLAVADRFELDRRLGEMVALYRELLAEGDA